MEAELTPAKRAAWNAYYTALLKHPEATAEERDRAKRMLEVGKKLGLKPEEAEDFV